MVQCEGSSTAVTVVAAPTDPCLVGIPDALSFVEPLQGGLTARDIVILSGSHTIERTTCDFGKLTSENLRKFAEYHGYRLVFLHELGYDTSLSLNGVQFTNHWQKPFAFPTLREKYPDAKYFVWLDDDILVPYPESDMLNHYINMMEADHNINILLGDDIQSQVMNAGMYFMKNNHFSFWILGEIKYIGLENNGHWARNFHHEQSSMVEIRKRYNLDKHIRVIKHREGRYNFNTFVDKEELLAKQGDAFVHYVSMPSGRFDRMTKFMQDVVSWRASVPDYCLYPMNVQ